jgi:3-oxoadipate CoA-transferase alpha subunit
MIDKTVGSIEEAVSDIRDDSMVSVGGHGYAGTPFTTYMALANRNPPPRGITLVGIATRQFDYLVQVGSVKKVITTYPGYPANLRTAAERKAPLIQAYKRGEVEVEIVPLGNLIERLRAGGAGIPAFYTPIAVGTELGEGKETRVIEGKECMLEWALKTDYALIKAHKGDRHGNLVYKGTARSHNPVYAMAADFTIAEVDEIVELGTLDPETVITPGIFVDRIVEAPKVDPFQYFRDFFYEEMRDILDYVHAKQRRE